MKLRRTVSCVLSACMLTSMLPTSVLAVQADRSAGGTTVDYELAEGWEIMGEDTSHYQAQDVNRVDITAQYGDLYYEGGAARNTAKNVFLHTVEAEDFEISATLDFQPNQDYQTAGLIIYGGDNANFALTRRYHSWFGGKALCIQGVNDNAFVEGPENKADPSQTQETIDLRIVKDGTTVTSYYRLDGQETWTEHDSRTWTSFEGLGADDLKVGLYTGNSMKNGSTATFSNFTIQYEQDAEPQQLDFFVETEVEQPDQNTVYASDWDWASATVGYGSAQKDCGVDGSNDPIVLGGTTYAKGIAAHAASKVVYDIEGKGVQRFQAVAGVNRSQGSCEFIVEADGVQLAKTGVLSGSNTQEMDVEIPAGTKTLTLITTTGGDNGNYDHSIWGDAKFVLDPNINPIDLRKISVFAPGYLPENGTGTVEVQGEQVNGEQADLSGAAITYESSDEAILTVDGQGNLTAVGTGTATVTVTVTLGETVKTAQTQLLVGAEQGAYWDITSPDGSISTRFLLTDGQIQYVVQEDGQLAVDASQLGLVTDAGDFSNGLTFLSKTEPTEVVDEYDLYGAKVSHVKATGMEMTLSFAHEDGAQLDVIVRVYDDGMAFRYVVKGEDGQPLAISAESTTMTLPAGSTAYAMDYIAHNEEIEREHAARELDGRYCMPLLYKTTDGTWCLISEAALSPDYCGTYLQGDGTGSLNFHHSVEQNGDVETQMPFTSPWRFVVIGTPEEINLNTMAETLSPDAEGDFSWVEPGVTAWTWLNRESTSSGEVYMKYVDFAAEMGWEYLLLDEGWQPRGSSNGHPEYNYYGYYEWTEELIAYAKEKGVRLLVWANHNDLKDPVEREKRFAQWEEWGIAGVKPDFFNSSSQDYMELYDALIQETAEHHLLLNLHGMPKPAGERRTYPHLLTREGVFGHEQELFRPSDVSAFHNCMLPFVRNAVGPADYTPMFSYQNSGSKTPFSLAHMAAMAVVYESGIQCLADRPDKYIGSPAEFYFKDMPATWDESVVLQADPGELVTIARRNGEDWYVGAMCNTQQDAVIDLSFLGDGAYYAFICKDGDSLREITSEMKVVTREDTLTVPMLATGGAAVKILRNKPSQPESIQLDQTQLTMEKDSKAQLTATITPEDTEMSQVTWTSSDESVVTVQNGQLVALAPGQAVITASTGFGGELKAQCTVTVTMPQYVLTSDWEVVHPDPDHWQINEDGSVTIDTQIGELYSGGKFTVKNLFLTPIKGENFTVDVKLDFQPSGNYQTAGVILFLDEYNNFCVSRRSHSGFGGEILAYHGINDESFVEKAIADPTVDQAPVYLRIAQEGTVLKAYYSLDGNDWVQIAQEQNFANFGDGSSLKMGLYVANGDTSGIPDQRIPATFQDFTVTYEGQDAQVIPFAQETVYVEGVTLDQDSAQVQVGQTVTLNASVLPQNATCQDVTWSTSDPAVATVDENGVVTGVAQGTATITVTTADGGKTARCVVQVGDLQTVNKTLLQKTYDYALTLSTDGVTDSAKAAFETALANAKAVLDDEAATQDQVNAAWDALLEGIWGLGLTQGDKTMLNLLIDRAQDMIPNKDKYVADHWQQLVDALGQAQKVAADGDAMQEDVDQAAQALLDAILAQRFKADKSILEELVGQAEDMNLAGYTAESVAVFRTALANAQDVLADETLTEDDQKTVDAAVEQLTRAMDGLTAGGSPEATDKPETTDKPEETQKPNQVPQTGDSSVIALWMVLLAGCAAGMGALTVVRTRRKEH